MIVCHDSDLWIDLFVAFCWRPESVASVASMHVATLPCRPCTCLDGQPMPNLMVRLHSALFCNDTVQGFGPTSKTVHQESNFGSTLLLWDAACLKKTAGWPDGSELTAGWAFVCCSVGCRYIYKKRHAKWYHKHNANKHIEVNKQLLYIMQPIFVPKFRSESLHIVDYNAG